jgi:hypothetical protein
VGSLAGLQACRLAGKQRDRRTHRQNIIKHGGHAGRRLGRQVDKLAGLQAGRQTERQADVQAEYI